MNRCIILNMSSKAPLAMYERVSLIPFKRKGQLGTIQFIGEIEGKNTGNWVGIELDDEKGDCDGDCNGNQIFKCKAGHGLFLRPTQVKSLDNEKMNESSIMKVDESLISGRDNAFFASTVSTSQDINKIEGSFDLGVNEERQEGDIETVHPTKGDANEATGGGKVVGWKQRLAILREQKEREKQMQEESKQSTLLSEDSRDMDQLKDMFAPAKGLERGTNGKLQIDKEKVEEKKEIALEPRSKTTLEEPKSNKQSVISSTKSTTSSADVSKDSKVSPQKPRLTLMERQALKDAEKKAADEAKGIVPPDASKDKLGASLGGAGGLKAPSRLMRPTAASAATNTATEDRKQKLLEKQKAVNAKLEEKAKLAEKGGEETTRGTMSRLGATSKLGETTTRASIGGAGAATRARLSTKPSMDSVTTPARATRLGATTTAARPGRANEKTDEAESGARTTRGSSASKDDLKFGAGRQRSGSRDTEIKGLGARGSSANKDKDLKFGTTTRVRGSSKDKMALGFGQGTDVKIDADSTIIKKAELELLKLDSVKAKKLAGVTKELEDTKEEVYNITIKMKKAENKCNTLIRDHKDQIDELTLDLTQKTKKAHEDLMLKFSEERNKLIVESNKSTDSKFKDLKTKFDAISIEKSELEVKLTQTIEDLNSQKDHDIKELHTLNDKLFEEMKSGLNTQILQINETATQEQEKIKKMVEKITQFKVKIDGLEESVQAQKFDLEANQIEIELLKDEKQELLAEMTENSKLESEDVVNSLGSDELKQQNRKLRQAVTSLAQNFEAEKAKLLIQIQDEEGKKKIIAEYEKKLLDMDVLLEELDRKEEEIAEVRMENEACLEYENMVEEMAQEILKKEEECDELNKKLNALENILGIQEGYSENLEQYNQELTEDLAEQEAQVTQIENQKIEDEELLLDLEEENQKYREKVQQLNKTVKELHEQLAEYTENVDEKSKIGTLVDKQNQLIKQLRNNENRELDNQLNKIEYHWNNLLKAKVVEGVIPPRLKEHVHFDSLSKVNSLNKTMYRAILMVRYICEKQLPNVVYLVSGNEAEDLELKVQTIKMMITVSEQAIMFINSAQRIILCVSNMSVEQYIKATTTLMAWSKIQAINEEMGHIIDRLKDENISTKFDTSVLEGFIRQISELHLKIEKMFIEKSPEEIALEDATKKDDVKTNYQMTPAQLERQKMIQQAVKLDVRHQALRMCLATVALKVLIGDILVEGTKKNSSFIQKSTLVYGRLLDIIFKLDHIDAEDTGKEYLNMQDLVIDKRLTEKYDVISMIWSDGADPMAILSKDWNSVLDAIQRDITQLHNDYKFKRLLKQIDTGYENTPSFAGTMSIDEIFYIDRFKNETAPWMEISKKIRIDIQNSEQLKDTILQLNTKNRGQIQQIMQFERTINTMKVTIKSLEQRLATAQTKIEELNSVKGENEQMTKKHNVLKKQLEVSIEEIKGHKKHQEDMLKKYEELETKAAAGEVAVTQQSTHQDTLGAYRKSRGQNQPSRQSRTSTFFQELTKTSWLGGRKLDSSMTPMNQSSTRTGAMMGGNSADAQKLLYMQEENYQNIIYQLQVDRMKLRGQKVTEKLNKLQKQNGALNQYIKKDSEKRTMNLKLSRDDQTQLVKAIEKVDTLKTQVKLQMAGIKIVDLRKKNEDIAKAQQEEKAAMATAFRRNREKNLVDPSNDKSDCVKANMNINYMIIQAREQVNDAVKQLMSHDSKLTNLRIEKMSSQLEEDNKTKAFASTDEDSDEEVLSPFDPEQPDGVIKKLKKVSHIPSFKNSIQIGQIKIKTTDGKEVEKVRTKNIVFSMKSLKALQHNIGVFNA